jgi:transaldolase
VRPTKRHRDLGQSLWLDNISRDLLPSGVLEPYISELSVTGLTSNPTIFNKAIRNSTAYNPAIREKVRDGRAGEQLFFKQVRHGSSKPADTAGTSMRFLRQAG